MVFQTPLLKKRRKKSVRCSFEFKFFSLTNMALDADLAETTLVMDDLKKCFMDTEDLCRLQDAHLLVKDIQTKALARLENARIAVQALSSRADEAEAEAAGPPLNVLEETQAALNEEVSQKKAELEAMNAQVASIEEERRQLSEQAREIRSRRSTVDAAVHDALPRTKHQLGLYAHISKISWEAAAMHEGEVAGHVSDPKRGDVMPFAFKKGECSDVELANRLWDLIDTNATAVVC